MKHSYIIKHCVCCRATATLMLLTALMVLPITVKADIISRDAAAQRAAEYLDGLTTNRHLAPVTAAARLAPARARTAGTSDAPAYYVFSRGEGQGYVIATADDQAEAVLCYTDDGDFDYATLPDNMREWLDHYEGQLMELRRISKTGADGRARAPQRAAAVPTHPAIPELMTTRWNQNAPYNDECPLYTDGKRCVTGCVATAMAQVMYHQRAKSVDKTTKAIPAYNTGEIQVPGIPKGSPLDWDNMRDDGGTTAKQKLAVAQLMHYCGVSVEMGYTSSESGAFSYRVAEALQDYFGYGSNTKYVQRYNYSSTEWDALLYNELAHGNPVYLSGYNSSAGHAFVCDGYNGKRQFHINWGWGGSSNGYFLLNNLTPGSQGIGGSSSGYNEGQDAVIGAVPANYGKKAITFEDNIVKRQCVAAWDDDGDGVLSYNEAAKVTDLGGTFKGTRIKSFAELSNFTKITAIPDDAFNGCTQLASISLPEKLQSLGANAFNGCKALKNLLLPESVTTIGEAAFKDCRGLTDIGTAAATVIAPHTFEGCVALTSFDLPASVTSIGEAAFAGCTKLKTFTINAASPEALTIGEGIFGELDLSSATLNIPAGLRAYYEDAPQWCDFGTIYEVRQMPDDKFMELQTGKAVYLYNVGMKAYLTRGEAYGTQAVVGSEPMRFLICHDEDMPEGQYYLYSNDTGNSNHILFRTTDDSNVGKGIRACFVDGTLSDKAYWTIEDLGNQTYRIQVPEGKTGYIKGRYLGIQPKHQTNALPANVNTTMGAYFDVSYNSYEKNCQWMFVDVEGTYGVYNAAEELQTLLEMPGAKRINVEREQAVLDNLNSTQEELVQAQRTLRKKLNFIHFDDEVAKEVCTGQWDIDANGEVSYTEAGVIEELKENMFAGTKLHNMDVLEYCTGLSYIAGNTFLNCTELTSVRLPSQLVGLYYQVFKNCTSLEEIEIPSRVQYLGFNCFEGCTALRTFRIANHNPSSITLGEDLFKNVDLSTVTLYVPQGSKELYAAADIWKDFGEIREMRAFKRPDFIPINTNERVLIYNIGTGMLISNGEAYGTQAVIDNEGLVYRVSRTNSMAEGLYYFAAESNSTKNILFRTNSDKQVGTGVKACFVDGVLTAKAHWAVKAVEGLENVYTFQVPSNSTDYIEGEYLGVDLNHESSYTDGDPTYGLYWDIDYDANPENCQWAFISLDDVLAEQERQEIAKQLETIINRAKAKSLDVTTEQQVLDNFDSTTDEMQTAIAALRQKLQYIEFEDDKVKSLCISRFDLDEDDELSLDEAAAATTFGHVFKGNTSIKKLDELRYFTGVTAVGPEAFKGCTALTEITLPEKIQAFQRNAFTGCNKLLYMYLLNPSATAATLDPTAMPDAVNIFVEPTAAAAYEADPAWQDVTVSGYTGQPVVSAKTAHRYYGNANPTFIMAVKGAPVEGTAAFTSDATKASPVGDYVIHVAKGSVSTEGVTFTDGTLKVEPAPLTIKAKSYTIKSGEPLPEYEIQYSGFRNNENANVLTKQPVIACDATTDSPVGDYEIRVSDAEAANYAITFINGILTIDYPDGINSVEKEQGKIDAASPVFDLSGRRVSNGKMPRGIYITGGRKVVVK